MKVQAAEPRVGGPKGIDARLIRALVLAAWSAFFVYLRVSGEMTRYLGPRTYWVVTFGAVTLGLAAAVHLMTLRSARKSTPTRSDLVGFATLLIPLLAITAVPRPDLGALAASRKATGGVGAAGFVAPPAPEAGREPSFIDVHFANESDEYAATLGIADGTPMHLVGFVSEEAGSDGAIQLSRFYVSCCAADAIPYSVTVQPGDSQAVTSTNTWLEVSGSLTRTETGWVLVADDVKRTAEPENPYLY